MPVQVFGVPWQVLEVPLLVLLRQIRVGNHPMRVCELIEVAAGMGDDIGLAVVGAAGAAKGRREVPRRAGLLRQDSDSHHLSFHGRLVFEYLLYSNRPVDRVMNRFDRGDLRSGCPPPRAGSRHTLPT